MPAAISQPTDAHTANAVIKLVQTTTRAPVRRRPKGAPGSPRIVTQVPAQDLPRPIVIYNDHSILSLLTIYMLYWYICDTQVEFIAITSNAIPLNIAIKLESQRKRGHKFYCIGCTLDASIHMRPGVDVTVDDHMNSEKNMFTQLFEIFLQGPHLTPQKKVPEFESVQTYAHIAYRVESGTASHDDLALYTSLYMALRPSMRQKEFAPSYPIFTAIQLYMRETARNRAACLAFGQKQIKNALDSRASSSRSVQTLKGGATVVLYQNVRLGSFQHVLMESESDFTVFVGPKTIIVHSRNPDVHIKGEFCDNAFYHGYQQIMYISHDTSVDIIPQIMVILDQIPRAVSA
jgi:hypothetical protein